MDQEGFESGLVELYVCIEYVIFALDLEYIHIHPKTFCCMVSLEMACSSPDKTLHT